MPTLALHLLTIHDIAARLNVTPRTVYRLIREKEGGPPVKRIGGQYRCRLEDLESWIATQPPIA